MAAIPPPGEVMAAFGLVDEPLPLAGGEGRSWRSGQVVLKRSGDAEEAHWIADVLAVLPEGGFRVPRPVATADGSWVASGWTASRWVEGAHDLSRRWPEVLRVGEAFHAATADLAKPAFIDRRVHEWSIGDRAAWGEAPAPPPTPVFEPILGRLYAYLRPISLPSQVIHGDLPGNIQFSDGLAPAVIDFSPYFRPAGFAAAVVVVDAIVWYGASFDLVDHAGNIPEFDQLLARAAIYRLVTADVVSSARGPEWAAHQVEAHRPLLGLIRA